MNEGYEPVIGLEVHAHLLSRTKLFCGCATTFGAPPNTQVCPVCLGLPGALPVTNAGAVELAVRVGLALGSNVRPSSRFARKNYFYPDLAKGYQISQYEAPLCDGGAVEFEIEGACKRVALTRIHMEEDAAKNGHHGGDTLVDFNRAGVPLVEIVSEPEIRSAEQAEAYLRRLREVLMALGVNDGNLEEGSFRCDANVSVRAVGTTKLGTRVELKNINSFRFVRKALEYEVARQIAFVSSGRAVVQETRTWSEEQASTFSMRGKEQAHDYRYFPDPDLQPLRIAATQLDAIRAGMPKLPDTQRQMWREQWGLTEYDARVLSGHPAIALYFEDVVRACAADAPAADIAKTVANFVQAEVLGDVTMRGLEATFPVPAADLAELLRLVRVGTLSGKMAKDVLGKMAQSKRRARDIVDAEGLAQVSDAAALEEQVRRVIEAHPAQCAQYRAGKVALVGFFVGQVMKATKGSANPAMVNEIVRRLLCCRGNR